MRVPLDGTKYLLVEPRKTHRNEARLALTLCISWFGLVPQMIFAAQQANWRNTDLPASSRGFFTDGWPA
ncbi:hypothetical protein BN2476_110011 [Paraburkholderia piptadeniae]|uniref:Uncharacterized protein n=1 Tax=Paraburkholderia piptadeniae TaxID=1701573 RepID=A0A1N7RPA3_9BURK|nr:hypothetical protein BN2476_110011 [Paraburkholderia piptadeniae]